MHDRENERTGSAQPDRTRWVGAVLLALVGVAALYLAADRGTYIRNIDPDAPYYRAPDTFPLVALLVAGLGSLAMAVRHVRRGVAPNDEALPRTRPRLPVVAAVTGAFAFYIVLTPWIGYGLATVLFVVAGLLLSGTRPGQAVTLAIAAGGVLWAVFQVALGVWFPEPALLDLLNGG